MIAHRRQSDGKEQAWNIHSRNVSKLCRQEAEKLRLRNLAELMGLLHDWGKGTADLQNYLRDIGNVHPNHAGLGALFVWRRWHESEKAVRKKQTAQLISLCIYGHHAGLPDCLDISGYSPYLAG